MRAEHVDVDVELDDRALGAEVLAARAVADAAALAGRERVASEVDLLDGAAAGEGEAQAVGLGWFWIGASSSATPGTWSWPDGEVFWIGDWNGSEQGGNYSMWRDGAPGSASTPYCGYRGTSGNWDYDVCSNNRHWVCEAY